MADHNARHLAGRYEVRAMIGRGGMAQVHLGFDTRLSRIVAIKMLRTDLARDSVFQTRFRREAQAAASLNHPNIVGVYDTGEEDVTTPDGSHVQVPYIVMEYVEGHSVRDLLAGGTPVPIDEAVEIISGVLSALEYSHAHGLVHRDIKPGNIMLTNTGKIKVMDFGIARALTDSQATMTQTNAVVGTAQYLSPEQARGEVVDARSDIYSTGCVLFELLTGQTPFKGDSAVSVAYQHVSELPPTPSSITADIPDSIDRVVMKALAKKTEDRYASAEAMRADLERAAHGAFVLAPATDSWDVPATATTTLPAPPPPGGRSARHQHTSVQPAVYSNGNRSVYPTRSTNYALAEPDDEEPQKKSKKWIVAVVVALLLVILAGGGLAATLMMDRTPEVEMVTVPAGIRGADLATARQLLRDAGLEMVEGERQASTEVPANHIITSDPEPGASVAKNSQVKVTISTGPQKLAVPDVTGMTQNQARDALKQAGLTVGNVTTEDDPSQDKDKVLRTDPAVGTEVKEGDTVALVLASGQVVVSTDLIGQDENTVVAALQKLKLNTRVQYLPTNEAAEGTVLSLSSTGNIAVGSEIVVTVAQAKPEPQPTQPTQPPSNDPGQPGDGNNNGNE